MAGVKCVEILSPGLQTTIQDLGRYGFGPYGVPPSGVLDSFAARIANRLVDNSENFACLETTLMGLRLKVLCDVCIAVTGADLQPHLNKTPLKLWRSHRLTEGHTLSLIGPKRGCRAYIAFGGGIQTPAVLGSRSTNLAAGFGGINGRPLQKGDVLDVDSPRLKLTAAGRAFKPSWIPEYSDTWTLRIVWGPQENDFMDEAKCIFVDSVYEVSPQSDRSGIRLQGPMIKRKADRSESIISEGLISGSIQVPGGGKPIIILGETVSGGYRKIATVISADLPLLGQIKPGDRIQFTSVSMNDAYRALVEMENKINTLNGQNLTG
jgi:antagonist of KipI